MERKDQYLSKVRHTKDIIIEVYTKNNFNWMVGFSGGKDSTVLVQIIMEALLEIPNISNFDNIIHIVSSDTLIENPIVLKQLNTSLKLIENFAIDNKLPIKVHKVEPDIEESFWVNLIGRGYPLPNQSFRWCTDRLKIKPMNQKMEELSLKNEVLTVLGVRKGESASRDIKLVKNDIKDSLFKKNDTNNKLIFAPIEEFSLYDIWSYLAESRINFFKTNNNTLSLLYEDSSVGVEECPSSLDDKLQKGCGNSRWGCWLCPVVTQDKSLEGFVNSGQTWLKPLLEFREELIQGRDKVLNRFNASLRISKTSNNISLLKYRYMDLKIKNDNYFLPKKLGRDEIRFGYFDKNKNILINDKKIKVISETEYKNLVDTNIIDPYSNSCAEEIFEYVIKLDKNSNNQILSVPGLGPYTLKYRKELLKSIKKLKREMSSYDIEIISDQEIKLIEKIIVNVENKLNERHFNITKEGEKVYESRI
ncbi:DNA phosphorothioation system sulfurtransferase DndC [Spiroplasma culicicola]|uniref:Phosphoadenosine phosphosulphate reductase domain-containing protein n=1 Tax=Spiroplasma culicicola AES-1 TaxID=1276246 RepID=W6A7E3_9MOLU|nr:DNA phosphorothioation system sulfurtransferase DndC [Spiroplasma culicicola]AHI52760.1 hypothetical protein SCULI_v1c04190 [Spiroplasma culicicola AES-1]